MNYYLDESGNTGDVARRGKNFAFDHQPIFVLACVGIDDEPLLRKEIDRLKTTHKVQAPELKSASALNKPELVSDIVELIRSEAWPLFVEIVDKRYFIVIHLVERLLLMPLASFDPNVRMIKNIMAEYLHEHAPAEVLSAFLSACELPSAESVLGYLEMVLAWATDRQDDIGSLIARAAKNDIEEVREDLISDAEAFRPFLPEPDANKRGTSLWMLPNLSSFTNIYARINLSRKGKLADVRLIHDEQDHHEHILRANKKVAEQLLAKGIELKMPHSDFGFTEKAELTFATSEGTPGVQLVDVLAGFLMRYTKDILAGIVPAPAQRRAFHNLLRLSHTSKGTGLNFVMSYEQLARLGVVEAK